VGKRPYRLPTRIGSTAWAPQKDAVPTLPGYKRLVVKANRTEGAVLYGDTVDEFQLMREGQLFGRHHLGNAGHGDERCRLGWRPHRQSNIPESEGALGCQTDGNPTYAAALS